MPLLEQTAVSREKVKSMSELSNGYNVVGLSQGNMVRRGVIEFCDDVPPEHLAPSGFLKIPTDMAAYLKGCMFLPKLNNELSSKNSTFKERFASLENLVLIMFEQDTVLIPKETSWFGYYPDGAFDPILSAQETKLYTEDWIGLKTLDEAGKVKFINVSGNHLVISKSDMKKYVMPYLENGTSVQTKIVKPLYNLLSSVKNYLKEFAGIREDGHLLLNVVEG